MRVLMLGRIGFVIDDPARLAPIFAKLNSVIRPLLKSPLHYVGGKTGNEYTFATGYFPWDDGDILVSSTANWARSLGSARKIQVLARRRWFTAAPAVIKEN
jgi:hypothetical protein